VLDMEGLGRPPAGARGGRGAAGARAAGALPYVGPCEQHIRHALDWALETGLTVNLCLHGAPGGQSGHDACGCSNPRWSPALWGRALTVRCLGHVARVFGRHPALAAITVVNEPSRSISTRDLVAFYCDAYAAIRSHSQVTVVMPVYQRMWWWLRFWGQFPPPHFDNVVFDLHLYQCFGWPWERCSLSGALRSALSGFGHFPSLRHILSSGHEAMVSEWSLRLPEWDASWPIARELKACADRDAVYREYASAQLQQFAASRAWYFWTWKVDAGAANGGLGEPHWDLRECLRRGWIAL